MAESVLTLDTLVERRTVIIDKIPYELTGPAELSLLDFHRLAKTSDRVAQLLLRERELEENEIVELLEKLDGFVSKVLAAPPEILAKLTETQKLAVLKAFTMLQTTTPAPTGATAGAGNLSTGL